MHINQVLASHERTSGVNISVRVVLRQNKTAGALRLCLVQSLRAGCPEKYMMSSDVNDPEEPTPSLLTTTPPVGQQLLSWRSMVSLLLGPLRFIFLCTLNC